MLRLIQVLSSTRLLLLLFLVPPAALWARSEGSGGFLLPTALALFACVHFGIFDTKTIDAGKRQRLGFTRHPLAGAREASSLWATYCLALFALVVVILLIASPHVGLFFLVLGAIALPLTGGIGVGTTKRRMLLCEIANPFAMLLLPAWWVASTPVALDPETLEEGAEAVVRGAGLVPGAMTVTWICALTFSAYLLACLIRDVGEDTSDGQITTPTLLGKRTAGVLMMLILAVTQIVAAGAITSSGGAFSVLVPAITAIGGMSALYAIATDAEDAAPTLLLLTQALLIVSFCL